MGYSFVIPRKVFTGEGALSDAKAVLSGLGKKAFIVTDPVINKLGIARIATDVLDELSIEYTVFEGITGEPTDEMITNALDLFREDNDYDFLLAVGGGSAIDSMKAIATIMSYGGQITDYMGKAITKCNYPMVAIPTTAGTGSEATKFTIITNTKEDIKMLLAGDCLVPDYAIIDPAFTMTATKGITAATGLDAFTHAIESYTSRKAQPLTDSLALSAVKRIYKYLPIAYHDGSNVEARSQMSIAALEAGICINNASVTVVHGMSRPIGAMFHVPHGISNAMLLPQCLAFALDGTYEKFANLGRAIGVATTDDSDKVASESFLDAVRWICNECEIPTLEGYGIDREEFFDIVDKMATDAVASGSPNNTIKECSKEDVLGIYKKLWE